MTCPKRIPEEQNRIAEAKVEAESEAGLLLRQIPQTTAGWPKENSSSPEEFHTPFTASYVLLSISRLLLLCEPVLAGSGLVDQPFAL